MWKDIVSSSIVYISTSIDFLFVLLVIFSQCNNYKERMQVFWGQTLGMTILVVGSWLAAYLFDDLVSQTWIIGLLGLYPIYIGLKSLFSDQNAKKDQKVNKRLNSNNLNYLFWTVTVTTLASGGDNIGVYIPYFSSLKSHDILTVLIVFIILNTALCFASYRLDKINFISQNLKKYERIIVPLVFIGLGIYILFDNGTAQHLWKLLIH